MDASEDAHDVDCPRCSSLVLATDKCCHNCDLWRDGMCKPCASEPPHVGPLQQAVRVDEATGVLNPAPAKSRPATMILVLKSALKSRNGTKDVKVKFAEAVAVTAIKSFKNEEIW